MKNRTQRLLAIKKIITTEKISAQDELLHKLQKKGMSFTQATLSRDLKFLKVSKVVDEKKGYVYHLPSPEKKEIKKSPKKEPGLMGFKSLKFSGNFGVIKSQPGHAPGIASIIDGLDLFEILGTIAGDDTILLIPNEGVTKQDVINCLIVSIPSLKNQLT